MQKRMIKALVIEFFPVQPFTLRQKTPDGLTDLRSNRYSSFRI